MPNGWYRPRGLRTNNSTSALGKISPQLAPTKANAFQERTLLVKNTFNAFVAPCSNSHGFLHIIFPFCMISYENVVSQTSNLHL